MHQKALAIEEKLGRKEGMANNYLNLGIIFRTRGDLGRAEELWRKALDLFREIGMKAMVKKVQDWLDGLKDEDGTPE